MIYWLFVLIPIFPMVFSLFYEKQREEDFVFIFVNAAILYFPIFFLKSHKNYLRIIFPFLLVPSVIDFGHLLLFQGRVTSSMFFIIFDTNMAESSEFLGAFATPTVFLSMGLFIILSFYVLFKINSRESMDQAKGWKKFFGLWILIPIIIKGAGSKGDFDKFTDPYIRSSQFLTMATSFIAYKEQINAFSNYAKGMIQAIEVNRSKEIEVDEVHVLVLGESLTRTHMSLYSYGRETNPKLKKRTDLFIFKDVMNSSPPGTYANIRKITTFENTEMGQKGIQPHIIDVMKKAGFRTYWLSNQLALGKHDTMTTVIAKQADESFFTNTTNSTTYDEKLLIQLDKVLEAWATKKFIVIHLFGSHMQYQNRYPKMFTSFTNEIGIKKQAFHTEKMIKTINFYDNAVLYNDFIMDEIFNRIKKVNAYSSLVYLSDHGEIIYDDRNEKGHPATTKASQVYEIPFLIWLSESYKKENSDLVHVVTSSLNRSYVSDDTIHTLMDIFHVRSKRYDATKSIINSKFTRKKRWGE